MTDQRRVEELQEQSRVQGFSQLPQATETDPWTELGERIRDLVKIDLNSASDVAFERIERNVRRIVLQVAPGVVPESIAQLIETVVTARTTALDALVSELLLRVARVEGREAAALLKSSRKRGRNSVGAKRKKR